MAFTRLPTLDEQNAIGRARLEITHPTSPPSGSEVPVASASLRVFRRGATVTEEVELLEGSTTAVPVVDSGEIVVGDSLFVESTIDDDSQWLAVTDVASSRTSITVQYAGYRLVLMPGMRMTPVGSEPALFADHIGGNPVQSVLTDSDGIAEFAVAVNDSIIGVATFDFVVRYPLVTGWPPQLHACESRVGSLRSSHLDVRDFATVQAALDVCPAGGRLYLPRGTYTAPPGGFVVRKPIELFGDGTETTVLRPNNSAAANEPVLKFTFGAGTSVVSPVYLHDFCVRADGPGAPTQRYPGSYGISFIVPDSTHQFVSIRMERLLAAGMGDDGFHVEGHDIGPGAIVFVYGLGLHSVACHGSGLFLRFATAVEMHNCYLNGNMLFGAYARECQVAWYACAFENNCQVSGSVPVEPNGPDTLVYDSDWGAQLRMNSCVPARVDACDFESFGITESVPGRTVKSALILENCTGALVSNSTFFNPTHGADPKSIDSTCRGIVIPNWNGTSTPGGGFQSLTSDAWATVLPCMFNGVGKPVEVGNMALGVSVHPQRFVIEPGAVGTVDFKPTGIALPTVTSGSDLRTWACEAVAAGHLLFDASPGVNRLKCWDGSNWRTVAWE